MTYYLLVQLSTRTAFEISQQRVVLEKEASSDFVRQVLQLICVETSVIIEQSMRESNTVPATF